MIFNNPLLNEKVINASVDQGQQNSMNINSQDLPLLNKLKHDLIK